MLKTMKAIYQKPLVLCLLEATSLIPALMASAYFLVMIINSHKLSTVYQVGPEEMNQAIGQLQNHVYKVCIYKHLLIFWKNTVVRFKIDN